MRLLAYDLLHASIAFRGPIEAVSGEGTSPSGPSGWWCLTSTIFVDAIDTVRRECCCPVRTGSLAGAARAGLPGSPGRCSAALWLGRFVARACRSGLVRRGRSCPACSRSVSEGVLGHADAERACLSLRPRARRMSESLGGGLSGGNSGGSLLAIRTLRAALDNAVERWLRVRGNRSPWSCGRVGTRRPGEW